MGAKILKNNYHDNQLGGAFVIPIMFSIVILGLFLLLLYMWVEGRKNKVNYTELSFCHFPNEFSGMKLFFISDIHHREVSETIIKEILGNVDCIIIGGDLTEKDVPFSRVEKNIKALTKVAPTYFVWGNNDYEVNHLQLETLLKNEGVKILANSSIPLKQGNESVYLIGVDDFGHRFDNLEEALSGSEKGFKVLVSHNPDIKKKLREEHNINVILSGHTHGGQIRIFGFGITERAGLFKLSNNIYMLISNGYGTTRLPLRLGAPAETHVITFLKKDK